MLVQGIKIITVNEVKNGRSLTNGKLWSNRNILLGFEDEFGESFIQAVVDEEVWQRFGFSEGDSVDLHLRFRTHPWKNGKFVTNDIRIIDPQILEES